MASFGLYRSGKSICLELTPINISCLTCKETRFLFVSLLTINDLSLIFGCFDQFDLTGKGIADNSIIPNHITVSFVKYIGFEDYSFCYYESGLNFIF